MAKRTPHRKTGIIKHKVADGIYLLRFKTQYELTSTFLRVQEHYESPQFHGRIFTLEQYMDWYVARYGSFSYYQDWSGFNVPSTAFQPFYDGKFDPLTEKEKNKDLRGCCRPCRCHRNINRNRQNSRRHEPINGQNS